jgi:hypothetical protein
MTLITAPVGRGGANHEADVRAVQALLNRHAWAAARPRVTIDGQADSATVAAIEAFQRAAGLPADGVVAPDGPTLRALEVPPPGTGGSVAGAVRDAAWPPRPGFPPLVDNDARAAVFGRFEYVADPLPRNPENVRILGDWVKDNIVTVRLDLGPALGARDVKFHRKGAVQLRALWDAWKGADLLDRVLSYAGSFVPRFVRGSTIRLSNHCFGSAFDVNVAWNQMGKVPALLGDKGCVRELVPIAHDHGFYWGGHFTRQDGMHFEVARVF